MWVLEMKDDDGVWHDIVNHRSGKLVKYGSFEKAMATIRAVYFRRYQAGKIRVKPLREEPG